MATKILFTLAVVAAVFWAVRFRQRAPAVPSPPKGEGRRRMRVAALVVAAVMGGGAAVAGWLGWRHAHEVMAVTVIEAGSGRVSHYRVYRNRLKGRSFETVDGRRVRLAETERLEVSAAP